MRSGLEIGVAATKTYISQLICITLLAIKLGRLKGTLSKDKARLLLSDLVKIPDRLRNIVENADKIKNCARIYKENYDFMYIGRRYNIATAYEGALKLKEISYLHAEGYGGGEMKHGPLALVDEKLVTIAIALKSPIYEKMLSNIQEIKARKGKVIAVACDRDKILGSICDHTFYIPESLEITSPILAIVPLQLFAYYVAVELGRDVDKPRNLAKSVTVE
jgi:glucosamine--fructose-6-phosphate aminotransferase (isomerizing)